MATTLISTGITFPDTTTQTTAATAVVTASDAEVRNGTDTANAVTPANIKATQLGWGQTWQDVNSSRSLSTTYTNSTGRPITVSVVSGYSNSSDLYVSLNGNTVQRNGHQTGTGEMTYVSIIVIVPDGDTYIVGGTDKSVWMELR